MRNDIVKAVIKTVVLLPADEAARISNMSLSDIERETYDGSWIGMSSPADVEPVAADKLDAELRAIGNDGTFFSSED